MAEIGQNWPGKGRWKIFDRILETARWRLGTLVLALASGPRTADAYAQRPMLARTSWNAWSLSATAWSPWAARSSASLLKAWGVGRNLSEPRRRVHRRRRKARRC